MSAISGEWTQQNSPSLGNKDLVIHPKALRNWRRKKHHENKDLSASYTYCWAKKISSFKYLTSHVSCHLTVQGEKKFSVIVYLGLLSKLRVWKLVDIIPIFQATDISSAKNPWFLWMKNTKVQLLQYLQRGWGNVIRENWTGISSCRGYVTEWLTTVSRPMVIQPSCGSSIQ